VISRPNYNPLYHLGQCRYLALPSGPYQVILNGYPRPSPRPRPARAPAALDERSVYFLARLSPRYPTIEVRVADVCLDTGTAVLLAGLTRALVATALAEARRGTPVAAPPARQVAAALVAAARHGLAGAGADPVTGQPVDAAALRARLLDHVYPALRDHGDTQTITGLLRRLDARGTGADRQRALFTSGASTPAFITALARATLSGYEPGRWRRPDARVPAPAGAQ
jgi:glutamate---cysteine ligase / carboxylate-amine ligase